MGNNFHWNSNLASSNTCLKSEWMSRLLKIINLYNSLYNKFNELKNFQYGFLLREDPLGDPLFECSISSKIDLLYLYSLSSMPYLPCFYLDIYSSRFLLWSLSIFSCSDFFLFSNSFYLLNSCSSFSASYYSWTFYKLSLYYFSFIWRSKYYLVSICLYFKFLSLIVFIWSSFRHLSL